MGPLQSGCGFLQQVTIKQPFEGSRRITKRRSEAVNDPPNQPVPCILSDPPLQEGGCEWAWVAAGCVFLVLGISTPILVAFLRLEAATAI